MSLDVLSPKIDRVIPVRNMSLSRLHSHYSCDNSMPDMYKGTYKIGAYGNFFNLLGTYSFTLQIKTHKSEVIKQDFVVDIKDALYREYFLELKLDIDLDGKLVYELKLI